MNFKPYQDKIVLFQDKYVKDNAEILDIGCGSGNNAKLLYQKNNTCKITGIDLSEKMIKFAKSNTPSCRFIQEDVRNLSFVNSFDIIFLSFCIVHI